MCDTLASLPGIMITYGRLRQRSGYLTGRDLETSTIAKLCAQMSILRRLNNS
jgi:hypothetical protein